MVSRTECLLSVDGWPGQLTVQSICCMSRTTLQHLSKSLQQSSEEKGQIAFRSETEAQGRGHTVPRNVCWPSSWPRLLSCIKLRCKTPDILGQISCNLHSCVSYLILATVLTNGPQNLTKRWPFTHSLILGTQDVTVTIIITVVIPC